MNFLKKIAQAILASLFWSSLVWAQADTQNKGARKQTLNFEDELVEGNVQKPDLFYIFQRKNFNYKRLIKLRENFLPEMRQTAEDIQRVRGGN